MPVSVDVSKVLVTFVENQKATLERIIKLEKTATIPKGTADGSSVILELPSIPLEEEAHIEEALEKCKKDPTFKKAFLISFFRSKELLILELHL